MSGKKRSSDRSQRASRARARVKTSIPSEIRAKDPLVHSQGSGVGQVIRAAVVLVVAVGLHGFMLSAIFAANLMASSIEPQKRNETIEIALIKPPPPPPPPVAPPPPPAPEPEKSAPPPPKKKKPRKPPPPPKKEAPPPPDPTDLPPEPPKAPPKKQPRRIVGLSLESTVKGSGGASFATGNTRMGRTKDVADDASSVQKLDKTAPAPVNRKASRIPGIGRGKVSKPRPSSGKKLQPEYPPLLRAQQQEGNVTVEVRIDTKGRVVNVRILEKARFDEFNRAALAAAKKQKWSPATQGGKPIPYTLTYTYRFRVTD